MYPLFSSVKMSGAWAFLRPCQTLKLLVYAPLLARSCLNTPHIYTPPPEPLHNPPITSSYPHSARSNHTSHPGLPETHTPSLPSPQGLPPGHTGPCYPISLPGIRQHRVLSGAKDSDADSQARARFALLGNAVTVQVGARGIRQYNKPNSARRLVPPWVGRFTPNCLVL